MRNEEMNPDSHPSERDLIMAADGELPARGYAQVHAHLAACLGCRARMAEIEGTIADFARAHCQTLDPQLPPIDGPRALLRAQLSELASKPQAGSWPSLFHFHFTSVGSAAVVAVVTVLIAVMLSGVFLRRSAVRGTHSVAGAFDRGAVPDRSLTPGATRRVTISDVCSMPHEEVVGEVSAALRQKVFREYGIVDAHAGDYEIDYLIAPGLGGVEEIHNLWPEPYTSPTWNAHVKDALEEHLHQMVCSGKLDLATAQRDIATDWIAAYKKYFRTDRPLALRSGLI